MKKIVIKEVTYKGRLITMFEDGFGQKLVIIDNNESKVYFSISDAKSVINGKKTMYEEF